MQDQFYAEAKKYNVLPLDNSTLARWNTPRPSLTAGQTEFTYSGELSGVPKSAAPSILNRSYAITAEVEIPDGGAEGMIVTEGGRFGGYGLFLSKGDFGVGSGKVVFLYNLLDLKRTMWEGPELEAGKHTIVFDFKLDGPDLGKGGTARCRGRQGSGHEFAGARHPAHFPEDGELRCRPGYAHRRCAGGVSLRRSVQVHRQDRQADASWNSQSDETPSGSLPSSSLVRTVSMMVFALSERDVEVPRQGAFTGAVSILT